MNQETLDRSDAPVTRASSPLWKWAFLVTLLLGGIFSLFAVFLVEFKSDETGKKENTSRLKFDSPSLEVPNFETKEPSEPEPTPEREVLPTEIELVSLEEARGRTSPPTMASPVLPNPAPIIVAKPETDEPKAPFFEAPRESAEPPLAPVTRVTAERELSPYELARERRLKASLSGSFQGSISPDAGADEDESFEPPGGRLNLTVQKTATSVASRLSDLTFHILKGTHISCTLDTAIISDQAGLVGCTIPHDIYGADGTVVLLDRGSRVHGEYSNTTLTPGMKRIFVVWDRVTTPDGVVIDIASPGTGALGEAGMGGKIDNHYFERVGIPILMSAVSFSARSYARDALSSDQARFIEDGTNDSLSTVLGELARIKPTLYKNQGDKINIVVARDLDLSSVYTLESRSYGYRVSQ